MVTAAASWTDSSSHTSTYLQRLDPGSADGLVVLLEAFARSDTARSIPDWSYSTWARILSYPDRDARPQQVTVDLGRRRDAALSLPPVAALVDWAGRRRRSIPAAGAAAALVVARSALLAPDIAVAGLPAVARRIVQAVDTARPLPPAERSRVVLVADLDRLELGETEPVRRHDPGFHRIVQSFLRSAGSHVDGHLARQVEDAVIVAADWWITHCSPSPVVGVVDGLMLPGVIPAQELREDQRLSQLLPNPTLLGLVAGPRPGRGRSSQVAWRRGMTFWVAACLASDSGAAAPPVQTIRWWRKQLSALSDDTGAPCTPAIRPVGVASC